MEVFDAQVLEGLNRITFSIHKADSLTAMCDAVLCQLPELIHHEKSFFSYPFAAGTPGGKIHRSFSMLPEEQAVYDDHFCDLDYTAWYRKQENITVYRDSDVVGEQVMESASIYKDWVLRMGMRYVCGNVIRLEGQPCADFTLFRKEEHGDFSDREMFLLQLVTEQITLWCQNHCSFVLSASALGTDDPLTLLTPREREIVRLAGSESDLHEIAEQLSISYSTVRRHMANIYEKLNINSRFQLMILLQRKHPME